jgi:hypothetical protein
MENTKTQQSKTCWFKYNYGSGARLAWLYGFYDLEKEVFVVPRVNHERDMGWLYFHLQDGKQYLLFYYHRDAYIEVDREVKVSLVQICCECEDRIKVLGTMRIEFSSYEWLVEQRRKNRIPQQIMTFLGFIPYYGKAPEFTEVSQSREEQLRLLQMIRDGVVLKER